MRQDMQDIEQRVCDIASEQLGISRHEVTPESRLIEDLQCDSLDLVELFMELEDEFLVTIPNEPTDPVGKSVFTRKPFRLGDLAEIVYLHQGTGKPERKGWRRTVVSDPHGSSLPFSQLSGRWQQLSTEDSLFEPLDSQNGLRHFRRRSDGMRCVLIPAVQCTIGSDDLESLPDEQPTHAVQLSSFLIDAEPISTTAYCRFLNSVETNESKLNDWFVLEQSDDRIAQMQIAKTESVWIPIAGTENVPMVLVSWYGANAYSLWANGLPCDSYRTNDGFLPTEAQWEHAAQGAFSDSDSGEPNDVANVVYEQHRRGATYNASTMPLTAVHNPMGVSKFGLHHMAGNIWQWCRDWYDKDFYQRPESRMTNPVNKRDTGVRSERGGSWVGPAELCRTSYRRGRVPVARGRCLGFRCTSPAESLNE